MLTGTTGVTLDTNNASPAASGSISFTNASVTLNSGATPVTIDAGTNVNLAVLTATSSSVDITAGGTISSAGVVTGSSLIASAKTGINLQTNVSTLTSITNTGGDISITQPNGSNNLTITALSNTGGGNVAISNLSPSLSTELQVIVAGTVTNANGKLQLNASGDVVVNASLTGFSQVEVNADSNQSGKGALLISSAATSVNSTGAITVTAADIDLTGQLNSGSSRTTIRTTASRPIALGTGGLGSLSISSAELGKITAGTVQIGDKSYPQTANSPTNISTSDITIDAAIIYASATAPSF